MPNRISRRQFLKLATLSTGAAALRPFCDRAVTAYSCVPPPHSPAIEQWTSDTIALAWIGHSTILMRFFDRWILTDPLLFDRIGIDVFGLVTLGPQRIFAPALSLEQLPKPDLVLLSHAHMDHMDTASLRALTERFPKQLTAITAAHTADIIESFAWRQLIELDWGEQYRLAGLTVEALPVKHFGWRFPWERDRSRGARNGRSYNAYLLEYRNRTIVFGGDTAFTDTFTRFSNVDIALLPIGAYKPWHHAHCTPEEAIAMAQMMGASIVAPMHCTTFLHGREPFWEPPKRFLTAIHRTPLTPAWITVGQSFVL